MESADEAALRLLDQLGDPAYRRAAAQLIADALEQTADAAVVVEAALEIMEDPETVTWARPELGRVVCELGERTPDDRLAARCLAAAAGVIEATEGPQIALVVVVAALRRDPESLEAREQFAWMAEEPDDAPVYADQMELLAQDVVEGVFPRAAFDELLELAAPLGDELDSARELVERGA